MPNHSDMVSVDELDAVQGAGTIFVSGRGWKVADYQSSTLRRAGAKRFSLTEEIQNELEGMIRKEYDACL
jgi:hypothetical protein